MLKICLSIYFARILDVSLGTIRTVYFVKGKKLIASIIAFFEVYIWYIVARKALNIEINSFLVPVSYSLGYATGTYIGTYLSNVFIKGTISVNIVTKKNNTKLINEFRKNGYGVIIIPTVNDYDNVKKEMLILEINKNKLKELNLIINKFAKDSFIRINDTKVVSNGFIK